LIKAFLIIFIKVYMIWQLCKILHAMK